jgi:peptide/nickel transport system permease protein
MLTYLVKRVLLVVPTILVVLAITFVLLRVSGSPVDMVLGEKGGTPEQRARLEHELGLDRPLPAQFVDYFAKLFRGDMGIIVGADRTVAQAVADGLPNTLLLAFCAMTLATVVGVAGGVLSALRRDSVLDVALRVATFCFISTPVFWFGIVMLLVFAYQLGWLPGSATGTVTWRAFVLPVIVLGIRPAAFIARVTRSSMLDELDREYVRTARAKGLAERVVILKHVLANIAIPLVTVIGGDLGSLMGGTMITETVFSFNGVGRLAAWSVLYRQYDAVMAVALLWAAIFVIVNLLIDVTYAWADPRVTFAEERP